MSQRYRYFATYQMSNVSDNQGFFSNLAPDSLVLICN